LATTTPATAPFASRTGLPLFSGLHGRGYLQLIRVVTWPRQSADDPRGNARLRAQYTLERKADDDYSLAWPDRVVSAHLRCVGDGFGQAQDRQIGRRVGRRDWCPVAQHAHLAAAVDDMVVGEDIPGPADDKSGTARAQPLAARRSTAQLPRRRHSFVGVRGSWDPGSRGDARRFEFGECDFLRQPVATPRCLVA
jgi:hypothetical protein